MSETPNNDAVVNIKKPLGEDVTQSLTAASPRKRPGRPRKTTSDETAPSASSPEVEHSSSDGGASGLDTTATAPTEGAATAPSAEAPKPARRRGRPRKSEVAAAQAAEALVLAAEAQASDKEETPKSSNEANAEEAPTTKKRTTRASAKRTASKTPSPKATSAETSTDDPADPDTSTADKTTEAPDVIARAQEAEQSSVSSDQAPQDSADLPADQAEDLASTSAPTDNSPQTTPDHAPKKATRSRSRKTAAGKDEPTTNNDKTASELPASTDANQAASSDMQAVSVIDTPEETPEPPRRRRGRPRKNPLPEETPTKASSASQDVPSKGAGDASSIQKSALDQPSNDSTPVDQTDSSKDGADTLSVADTSIDKPSSAPENSSARARATQAALPKAREAQINEENAPSEEAVDTQATAIKSASTPDTDLVVTGSDTTLQASQETLEEAANASSKLDTPQEAEATEPQSEEAQHTAAAPHTEEASSDAREEIPHRRPRQRETHTLSRGKNAKTSRTQTVSQNRRSRNNQLKSHEITPSVTKEELAALKVVELREKAKELELDIKGLRKAELVELVFAESVRAEGFIEVEGILDIMSDGYGFLRTQGYLPSETDVYVSLPSIRYNHLRKGDKIQAQIRPAREKEKYGAVQTIISVNGIPFENLERRPRFADLIPVYPNERLIMEHGKQGLTARVIDLVAPIGKGQRGLIVSPPKAGKTTILKDIAAAISVNNPEVHLMCLLIDERPEEVTDMQRSIKGEVISSTFDMPSENHIAVSELVIERAKRLVECGEDVVILLDSLTRLARAYNLAQPASGRILSGGVDSSALYPPKRFLGAARNIEGGGSLTILASALIDTGSKMDEVIFEEFKGTGNMELKLDRYLADRRMFPAIDPIQSGTRKEDLLLDPQQAPLVWGTRRILANMNNTERAMDTLLKSLRQTRNNQEFLQRTAKKMQHRSDESSNDTRL